MWETANSSISPRDFYHTLCNFAPQFEGYRQHDSQELLAYLLDGNILFVLSRVIYGSLT